MHNYTVSLTLIDITELHYSLYVSRYCRIKIFAVKVYLFLNNILRITSLDIADLKMLWTSVHIAELHNPMYVDR